MYEGNVICLGFSLASATFERYKLVRVRLKHVRARNHRSHFTEVALQIIALGALPSCRDGRHCCPVYRHRGAAAALEEAPGAQFSEPLIFHLRLP